MLPHALYTRLPRGFQLTFDMQIVVVGGHARNIGKTSVMCGLLRGLEQLGWTAVKISPYGHGIRSADGHKCSSESDEHHFVLTEEKNARGRGDTCRFLAAGARRALWLRVREGQLAEAFPVLMRALAGAAWVLIESNSILDFLNPALYIAVLDGSNPDFKASARRLLGRADALAAVGPRFHPGAWPGIEPCLIEGKPVFRVAAPDYFNPDLCRFIRERTSHHLPTPPLQAEA